MPGEGGSGEVGHLVVEGDEAELVEAGHQAQELVLGIISPPGVKRLAGGLAPTQGRAGSSRGWMAPM